jgi:quercetin dioxygenase-like cupin family protein
MIPQPGDSPSRLRAGVVRFAPGAHTAWHRHLNGQTLHILDGRGLAQARGGPVIEVGPGDTIETPPVEWHWHGAAPDHFMTHLALSLDLADGQPGPVTEWGDHLIGDEYPGR